MSADFDSTKGASFADRWCAAWSAGSGQGDFDTLEPMYTKDEDVPIFDTIEPLMGFRGYADMKSSIYSGGQLEGLELERSGEVEVKNIAQGGAVILTWPLTITYTLPGKSAKAVPARMTQVLERRDSDWLIVLEHPSTIISLEN